MRGDIVSLRSRRDTVVALRGTIRRPEDVHMRTIARAYRRNAPRPFSLRNAGGRWSQGDVEQLRTLAIGNTPTRVIALKLGRSERAIYGKAQAEGVSLKPVKQSPYGDHP